MSSNSQNGKHPTLDQSPTADREKLPFAKGAGRLILAYTLLAFLIPDDGFRSIFPPLADVVDAVADLLPAISAMAKVSPIPDVVKSFYVFVWFLMPFTLWYIAVRIKLFAHSGALRTTKEFLLMPVMVLVLFSAGFAVAYSITLYTGYKHPSQYWGRGILFASLMTGSRLGLGFIGSMFTLSLYGFFVTPIRSIVNTFKRTA